MKARGAVVGSLLVVLLLSALYPVRQYFGQSALLRDLAVEDRRLSARVEELKDLRGRLLTDAEIERIAREEFGMVRPGELAFVIVPTPGHQAPPAPADVAARAVKRADDGPAWYERWWNVVSRSLQGMR
jgi:cell division protein FtsB